jgi:hypothetical protein
MLLAAKDFDFGGAQNHTRQLANALVSFSDLDHPLRALRLVRREGLAATDRLVA